MADRSLRILGQLVSQMTGASFFSPPQLYERWLAQLARHFEADTAFLRHHECALGNSTLVAEWPPPQPGVTATVHGVDDDIVSGGLRRTPIIIAASESASFTAVAPLLWGRTTTGVIGLTKSDGNQWAPEELETLSVVASLFAQLQARMAAESRLHRLAERDDLTNLYNRRGLKAELRRRLEVGRPGPVAVLFSDVDRLKSINDHLGHAAGDAFIQACAQRLKATAGKHATIARVGGDEFVVVPKDATSGDAAEALAHHLQSALSDPVRIGDRMITRTVSIGIAVGMPGVDTRDDLVRRADLAALAVKRRGGNAVAGDRTLSAREASRNEAEFADGAVEGSQPEIDLGMNEIAAVKASVGAS